MRGLTGISVVLMLCIAAAMSACQPSHPPMEAKPVSLPTAKPQPSLACATGPGQPWRFWQSASPGVSSPLVESGEVWASTQAGVFRVHPRTGAFTLTLDGRVSGQASSLFPMGEGRVWAAAERGNFYYDGKRWTAVQVTGAGDKPIPLAIDLEGNFWVHSYGVKPGPSYFRLPGHVPPADGSAWVATAMEYKPGSDECQVQRGWGRPAQAMLSFFYRSRAECQSLLRARPEVEKKFGNLMALDADGSVWWGGHGDSPSGLREGSRARLGNLSLSIKLDLPSWGLPSITPDPVHGVWLGMEGGLAYSDGTSLRWVPLPLGECKAPSPLYDLMIDSQGKAWAVAEGKIHALEPGKTEWREIPDPVQKEVEPGRSIRAIALAADGGLWMSNGHDLARLSGQASMPPLQLPDRDCFMTALVADARNVWSNMHCRQGEYYRIVQYDLVTGSWNRHTLSPVGVASVAITSDGNVYATARDGVYLYTGTDWRRVVDKAMYVMVADERNGLWLSTQGQLWYYQNSQLISHGQPFNPDGAVYLAVDSRNRLWAAAGETLQMYDGKEWRSINTPVKSINELHAGADGRIWLVGYNDLAVYDPAKDKQP